MITKQIEKQVKQIEMMDAVQLEEFAQKVHAAIDMPKVMFDAFIKAIDDRHKALANSFSFEIEDGEYKAGEMN